MKKKNSEVAKTKSEKSTQKIEAAKVKLENAKVEALESACFASFDCNALACFNCAAKSECVLAQQDKLCAAAVVAEKAKNQSTKSTTKK